MKSNKTEVIFVIDRSGSMSSIKQATEEGFQEFINKQKQEPGECYVSLYQFDDVYNVVFENRNIKDVTNYVLQPRGSTALRDALGKTINSVGIRLNNTPENERPSQVVFVVLTDGHENASQEFSQEKVKELVEHQTNKYNWRFVFMGANQDAVLVGNSYGFIPGLSMTYNATSGSTKKAFSYMSQATSALRCANTDFQFSNEAKADVVNEDDNSLDFLSKI